MADPIVETKSKTTGEIRITPHAVEEVKRIKAENKIPEAYGLRVGVKGGGCSGFTYVLGFDEKAKVGDMTLDIEGIIVFIDPKSLSYLSGTHLDYTDGLNGKGFVFNNP
ncbi:MAG: iron-sulfur cluster assembly accessory protein, partial [Bacteroidota bacterium]